MITGKTSSGFEFELNENVMDNMELLDALAEASDNNPLSISKVVSQLLGTEQRKKLYDHLRTEDGRVPVAAVNNEVAEMFKIFGSSIQGKN